MRIGFAPEVLTRTSIKCNTVNDYIKAVRKSEVNEEARDLLRKLEEDGHELFILASMPSSFDESDGVRIKRCLQQKLSDCKSPKCKTAVINEADFVQAVYRNHIMIFISNDKKTSEEISTFTESIFVSSEMNYSSLLDKISEAVNCGMETLSSERTTNSGMPSEEKLWLKYYRKADLKWSKERMSPYDRLVNANFDWPDETAMEFFGTKVTYKEFFQRIDKLSDAMLSNGVRKGMRIPLIIVNTPESIITLYALYKVKATIVPIFPLSTPDDFKIKLNGIVEANKKEGFSESYIFISDLVYGRVSEILPKGFKTVILPITASMPKILSFAFKYVLMPKLGVKPVSYNDNTLKFSDFSEQTRETNHIYDTSFDDDYTAVQLYTGGTIFPKAALLSEGNIDAASRQFYNDRFDFRRGDKIAAFMPLNHSFGLIIGTHVAATLGVNLDIIMKINFKRLDKLFLKDKVNLFGGIPNMFPAIRNNERMKDADLSHVKYILSGGASVGAEEIRRTTEFFKEHNSKAELHDGYGATESAGGVIYDGIPNIGTDMKIVEFGTMNEVGYEEIGELCLCGHQIMRGYEDENLTKNVLKIHSDGRVWLHTGDSAVIHHDGKVEIIGRMDRMIKVNGEQVILDDIEKILNELVFVEQSVAVKKKDDKRGYVPVAFILLKKDAVWSDELNSRIEKIYKNKLTGFSRPRKTHVVDEFPVTNVGKIDFKELEKLAESLK